MTDNGEELDTIASKNIGNPNRFKSASQLGMQVPQRQPRSHAQATKTNI